MDYKDNCGPSANEPECTVIKEESKLISELLQQECKSALNENISFAHSQPDVSTSIIGPLRQVKRKKPFTKKKPVKRHFTKPLHQDEERISDKDISKTRPNSENGDDTSHANNVESSNSASNALLERVLNEKKKALLSSPEVVQLLRTRMREKIIPKA